MYCGVPKGALELDRLFVLFNLEHGQDFQHRQFALGDLLDLNPDFLDRVDLGGGRQLKQPFLWELHSGIGVHFLK